MSEQTHLILWGIDESVEISFVDITGDRKAMASTLVEAAQGVAFYVGRSFEREELDDIQWAGVSALRAVQAVLSLAAAVIKEPHMDEPGL